jgi:hypothetical protein
VIEAISDDTLSVSGESSKVVAMSVPAALSLFSNPEIYSPQPARKPGGFNRSVTEMVSDSAFWL